MRKVLEMLQQARYSGDRSAIELLCDAVELLAHKVQELEPEEFTEEDLIPLDGKRLERDKLAQELAEMVLGPLVVCTQLVSDKAKELLNAFKEP
jgi:hypothetical protein